MKKKVSLKDIAEKVGVSTALVSYVLNNQKEGRIGKEISEKIRAAASKMNYRKNQIARSLRTNETNTIGLIIGDISNPFFSTMARIIEDEADRKKKTVIFGSSDENLEKFEKLLETLINRQVDGLIIAPPENAETALIYLQKQHIPFVLIDRYFPVVNADYVVLDNFEAAYNATKHLIDGGGKKIGMITYKTELAHLNDRKAGYLKALKDHKIKFDKSCLKEVDINNDRVEIERAMEVLLNLDAPPDAVLFTSNNIAGFAVKLINARGVKVPGSLSIVCFDEAPSLDLFYAPITYVQQPLHEMGQTAINLLLEKINDQKELKQVSLKASLVIRKSGVKNNK